MVEMLTDYKIFCEGVYAKVTVAGKGKQLSYTVDLPFFAPPTLVLLESVKSKLIIEMDIRGLEVFDHDVIEKLKRQFTKRAEELILHEVPKIKEDDKLHLVSKLIREMLGLGDIEFILSDDNLEEIVVNGAREPVRVYHKKYGWLLSNIYVESEAQILNYANIIARRVGRQITTLTPLLDAHLVTGDRSNAVLSPIASKGHTVTIRKFARDPWTVTDLIKINTVSSSAFSLLWLAFQYEMNVLFSGGTGGGKTTILNVCMPFIPPNNRIISMEDTRELQLPGNLYWTPLTTRGKNTEGKGEVTMLDLLVNSLRMRPDRIILGEMRKREEAEVLFEAMHTGHSVYATVHADSLNETIRRLTNPPINVPPNLLNAVDLNVVMFRDRRKNFRRVLQMGEFLVGEEGDKITVKPNMLYRWDPAKDKLIAHAASQKLFEKLGIHTGMSEAELEKDLATKKMILEWMVKKNIRDIVNVGKIFHEYYLDPEFIEKNARKNVDAK